MHVQVDHEIYIHGSREIYNHWGREIYVRVGREIHSMWALNLSLWAAEIVYLSGP